MSDAALLFKALADDTRLRALVLLARGELCVCDIMRVLDVAQSMASRHLAYLKNAGLVTSERRGLWMLYSLAPPQGRLHRRLLEWLGEAHGEIPMAVADLQALDDLGAQGELCAQRLLGERKSPDSVVAEVVP